jgi:hypothetical protein
MIGLTLPPATPLFPANSSFAQETKKKIVAKNFNEFFINLPYSCPFYGILL